MPAIRTFDNGNSHLLCNYCGGDLGAHAQPVGKFEYQLHGFCTSDCEQCFSLLVVFERYGGNVANLQEDTTRLTLGQLNDIIAGMRSLRSKKAK